MIFSLLTNQGFRFTLLHVIVYTILTRDPTPRPVESRVYDKTASLPLLSSCFA